MVKAVKSATLEVAGSSTRGGGWAAPMADTTVVHNQDPNPNPKMLGWKSLTQP